VTRRSWLEPDDALSRYLSSYVRNSDYAGLRPTWKADDLLVLNDDDVADLVREAVRREGSQAAFAKRYGINRTDLSAFLNGRRRISASLARALGLRKVYVFE
jgi:hypothetical protein